MKNRLTKLIFVAALIVAILGVGGVAYAAVTISATTVSSSGALTLTGATASTWSTTVGDVTIQSGDGAINLTAVTDIVIPSGVGITFAGTEKIESDGTDLTITVGANGDVNIGTDIGITFGNDGEKIEGDGTDLTITGNNINLTASSTVAVTGALTVSGLTTITGGLTSGAVNAVTGADTLTSVDCGKITTVTAGIDTNTLVLPEASTVIGCTFTIMYIGADGGALLDISPDDADDDGIAGSCTLAASVVEMSETADADVGFTKATINTGDNMKLTAVGANLWIMHSVTGICANN